MKVNNQVFIINSIDDHEHDFYNQLKKDNINVDLIKINDAGDFEKAVDLINQKIIRGSSPTLYLDMHGNQDGELVFQNHSTLAAKDLIKHLTTLNKTCQGQLDVIGGVCYIGRIHDMYNKQGFPPYKNFIGSTQPVYNNDCYHGGYEFIKSKAFGNSTDKNFQRFKDVIPSNTIQRFTSNRELRKYMKSPVTLFPKRHIALLAIYIILSILCIVKILLI